MPPPVLRPISLAELLHHIDQLMSATLATRAIAYVSWVEPPDLTVQADRDLLEQLLALGQALAVLRVGLAHHRDRGGRREPPGRGGVFPRRSVGEDQQGAAVPLVEHGAGLRQTRPDVGPTAGVNPPAVSIASVPPSVAPAPSASRS